MRVLLACHEARARRVFLRALRRSGIGVIAAPTDGVGALELARRHRPDVLLVDDELPGLDGVAGLQQLAAECANSRIVTLTGRYELQRGMDALLAGAVGYLSRGIAPGALVQAVQGVMRDEAAISRVLTMRMI